MDRLNDLLDQLGQSIKGQPGDIDDDRGSR